MCLCVCVCIQLCAILNTVMQVFLVDEAPSVELPLVGMYCWFLLWTRQFDRKSKSRINVTSSLTDALFSPVLLLLFNPAVDKHLHLWLIKHVFCLCVCSCTCEYDCVHADESKNLCNGVNCDCVHECKTVAACLCVFCKCRCVSPLLLFFFLWPSPSVFPLSLCWCIDGPSIQQRGTN